MAKKRGRGEGTIYPRADGSWAGQITVGYDPATRKHTRRTGCGATQQEVRAKLQAARQEAEQQSEAALGAMRIRDALDYWLRGVGGKVGDQSLAIYTQDVQRLNTYIGHLPLRDLDV